MQIYIYIYILIVAKMVATLQFHWSFLPSSLTMQLKFLPVHQTASVSGFPLHKCHNKLFKLGFVEETVVSVPHSYNK